MASSRSSSALHAYSTAGPLLRGLPSAHRDAMRRALAKFKETAVMGAPQERRAPPGGRQAVALCPVSMASRRRADGAQAQLLLLFGLRSAAGDAARASFLVYHPERRTLVPRLHPLHWARLAGLTRFAVLRARDDLLILGGYDTRRRKFRRQVLRYDLRRGRIYVCAKMATPRADFTAFALDGRVYCVGGRSRDGQLTRAAEYYEPMMGRWYADTPLPVGCAEFGVAATEREVVLVGGFVPGEYGQQVPSSHVWLMRKEFRRNEDNCDALVSVWRPVAPAEYPSSRGVYGHRCVYVPQTRRFYVVGGTRDGGPNAAGRSPMTSSQGDCGLYYIELDDVTRRDNDTFAASRRIFWKRRAVEGCRRSGAGVCAIGRRIFVVGGRRPDDGSEAEGRPRGETEVGFYDTRTKRWSALFELTDDTIDLSEVTCVHLEPNLSMKEFDFDRLDWMLQWALW